jgi:hypothetical protein
MGPRVGFLEPSDAPATRPVATIRPPPRPDPKPIRTPTIAVLARSNFSGDPRNDHLCEGIAKDIIANLTRFRNLMVIARHSAFLFILEAMPAQEVQSRLGALYSQRQLAQGRQATSHRGRVDRRGLRKRALVRSVQRRSRRSVRFAGRDRRSRRGAPLGPDRICGGPAGIGPSAGHARVRSGCARATPGPCGSIHTIPIIISGTWRTLTTRWGVTRMRSRPSSPCRIPARGAGFSPLVMPASA